MSRQFTRDFGTELALGNISGQAGVNIFGHIDTAGTTEATLWDYEDDYTNHYLSADTTLYVSSTSGSDTNVDVIMFGVDSNFNEVVAVANTNGQGQVAFSADIYRVFLCAVYGAVDPLGDLYVASTSTVSGGIPTVAANIKALILQGNNITRMGLYTVPAGTTAVVSTIRGGTAKADDFNVIFRVRSDGLVWQRLNPFQLYQNTAEFNLGKSGVTFEAGTDVEIRATSSLPFTVISFEIDGVLVDN